MTTTCCSTQITDVSRVLFVDQQHPDAVDYLSTLTLVGLKGTSGNALLFPALGSIETMTVMFHTCTEEVLYNAASRPGLRADNERSGFSQDNGYQAFDTLVIGSISRVIEVAVELLDISRPSNHLDHGEDTLPLAAGTCLSHLRHAPICP